MPSRAAERLHAPWVVPPSTLDAFREFVNRSDGDRRLSYVAVKDDADLVGCINLSEIVRGAFQSAYLGFYAFEPFAGQGLMREAIQLVLVEAFTTLSLHRLEANIRPANERSTGWSSRSASVTRASRRAISRSTANGATTSATRSPQKSGSHENAN